ncbi:glycosyltransferase family 2 protein [Paenibacillus sp. NPDC058174]|uniref:glycosyltransferase family 2 protein n=1 Tax=Paenibacillus sp. NPDC058174 TaxID=3346366 RepID=UPI0036D8BA7B
MKTISLVMIVRNEETVLNRCLKSVEGLVDEIVIVDTGSTDATKAIAAAYNAKIFDYKWNNNFSEARNFALEQATSDWNLVLDADEYFADDYREEIQSFINGALAIGRLKIINKFKDKEGDAYAQTFISRLFPRDARYEGIIHEQIVSSLPRVILAIDIQHDGYYEQTRSDRNIPMLLREIEASPQDAYYYYQIAKEYKGLERHDLVYQSLHQAYRYCHKSANYFPNVVVDYIYAGMACGELEPTLQVIQDEQEQLNDFADFYFASGLFYLEIVMKNTNKYIHLLSNIENCYLTCLSIGESSKYDSVKGTGSFSAYHNLGVFYEVTGQTSKALECYQEAAKYNYAPSLARLLHFHTVSKEV